MIDDINERIKQLLPSRRITVSLSKGDEKRLRLYIDRLNKEIEKGNRSTVDSSKETIVAVDKEDLLDPNDDSDLGVALLTAMAQGLTIDEEDAGLEGFPWGDVVSKEQADEERRRRKEDERS